MVPNSFSYLRLFGIITLAICIGLGILYWSRNSHDSETLLTSIPNNKNAGDEPASPASDSPPQIDQPPTESPANTILQGTMVVLDYSGNKYEAESGSFQWQSDEDLLWRTVQVNQGKWRTQLPSPVTNETSINIESVLLGGQRVELEKSHYTLSPTDDLALVGNWIAGNLVHVVDASTKTPLTNVEIVESRNRYGCQLASPRERDYHKTIVTSASSPIQLHDSLRGHWVRAPNYAWKSLRDAEQLSELEYEIALQPAGELKITINGLNELMQVLQTIEGSKLDAGLEDSNYVLRVWGEHDQETVETAAMGTTEYLTQQRSLPDNYRSDEQIKLEHLSEQLLAKRSGDKPFCEFDSLENGEILLANLTAGTYVVSSGMSAKTIHLAAGTREELFFSRDEITDDLQLVPFSGTISLPFSLNSQEVSFLAIPEGKLQNYLSLFKVHAKINPTNGTLEWDAGMIPKGTYSITLDFEDTGNKIANNYLFLPPLEVGNQGNDGIHLSLGQPMAKVIVQVRNRVGGTVIPRSILWASWLDNWSYTGFVLSGNQNLNLEFETIAAPTNISWNDEKCKMTKDQNSAIDPNYGYQNNLTHHLKPGNNIITLYADCQSQ